MDGHLTDDAFDALLSDACLSELERLEISEHLSFCDVCVAKYTGLLDEILLLSPIEPTAPAVMLRLRERARRVFFNKYTRVVAAASIAIVFWNIGVFQTNVADGNKMLSALDYSAATISEKTTEFTDNITQTVQNILNSIHFERGTNNHEKK